MRIKKIGYVKLLKNTFNSTISIVFNHFQVLRQLFFLMIAVGFLSVLYTEFGAHSLAGFIRDSTLLRATDKFINLLLSSIQQGILLSMIPVIVSLKHLNQSPDRSQVYESVKSHLLPALGISLILNPLTLLGYEAFILPGILISILFLPITYLFIVNKRSLIDSFEQSGQWFLTYWKSMLSVLGAPLVVIGLFSLSLSFLSMGMFNLLITGQSTSLTPVYVFIQFAVTVLLTLTFGAFFCIILVSFYILLSEIDRDSPSELNDNRISHREETKSGHLIQAYITGAVLIVFTVGLHTLFPGSITVSHDNQSNLDVDRALTATSETINKVQKLENKIKQSLNTSSDSLPESYWDIENHRSPEERSIPNKQRYLNLLEQADSLHSKILGTSDDDVTGETLAQFNRISKKLVASFPRQHESIKFRIEYYETKILSLGSDRLGDMLDLYKESLLFVQDLPKEVKSRRYTRIIVRDHISIIGGLMKKLSEQ